MLLWSVGLTAIEVSLWGPAEASQSVLALTPCGAVVQIAVPVFTAGPVPNTEPATGAGAPTTLWVKSTGCTMSSAETPNDWLKATTDTVARITPRIGLTTPSLTPRT